MTAKAFVPAHSGFSPAGERCLDLDRHLAERSTAETAPSPPLDFADGEVDLIHSLSAFARLREERPGWLAEMHRLLGEGGLLILAIPSDHGEKLPAPGGREWLALRKRKDGAPNPGGDPAGKQSGLAKLFERLDADALRSVDSVRESFDRELARKAFRIAELEIGPEATPAMWAYGERVAAEYEASLSWRVTRPLRAVGRLAGRR